MSELKSPDGEPEGEVSSGDCKVKWWRTGDTAIILCAFHGKELICKQKAAAGGLRDSEAVKELAQSQCNTYAEFAMAAEVQRIKQIHTALGIGVTFAGFI